MTNSSLNDVADANQAEEPLIPEDGSWFYPMMSLWGSVEGGEMGSGLGLGGLSGMDFGTWGGSENYEGGIGGVDGNQGGWNHG